MNIDNIKLAVLTELILKADDEDLQEKFLYCFFQQIQEVTNVDLIPNMKNFKIIVENTALRDLL